MACANMLENTWDPGADHIQQTHYQAVVDCTYWPMLGSFKKYNTIKFANKTTCSEDFDEVHKVFLDGISTNMVLLLHTG